MTAPCPFCEISNSDVNTVLAENRTCYARLDNFPATPGHAEIVPRRHVESYFDLTAIEVADAHTLLLAVRNLLAEKHQPDGYTIGVNDGHAAGRTVDHCHIHLIPRHFGDVPDPRGGIRRILPNCTPDLWAAH